MGGCLSMSSSMPSSSFDVIRVVHMNGFVEDLEDPVTVSEISGDPNKFFVCTPAELVSFSRSSSYKALPPETQLEPGHLYFKLPLTAFQWEAASPVEFVRLATRLTKVAKCCDNSSNARKHQQSRLETMRRSKSTPERVTSEQVTMQGRGSKSATERVTLTSEQVESVEQDQSVMMGRYQKYHISTRSWRPILETINEKSFGRRSDSDLHSPIIRTAAMVAAA